MWKNDKEKQPFERRREKERNLYTISSQFDHKNELTNNDNKKKNIYGSEVDFRGLDRIEFQCEVLVNVRKGRLLFVEQMKNKKNQKHEWKSIDMKFE